MKRETGNKPAATGEEIANIDGKVTSFITGVHSTFRQQPTSCSFGQYAYKIKLKTTFKNGICPSMKNYYCLLDNFLGLESSSLLYLTIRTFNRNKVTFCLITKIPLVCQSQLRLLFLAIFCFQYKKACTAVPYIWWIYRCFFYRVPWRKYLPPFFH